MKTIVITGASSGIGRATALHMSLKGHQVIAIARNKSLLQELASTSKNIHVIPADITTDDGLQSMRQKIESRKIDVLINNAGIMTPSGSLLDVNINTWRYQFSLNLEAPLILSRMLLTNLIGGRILNLTIYSSYKVTPGLACYGISKSALNMMTEYLRLELSAKSIGVGLALPGIVDTNIQSQLPPNSVAQSIPKLSPQVVAYFLSWLVFETESKIFNDGVHDIYNTWHQKHWNTDEPIMNPMG